MQKHNHPLHQRCDDNQCEADRFVQDVHEFTDATVDTTNGDIKPGPTGIVDEVIDRRRQVYGEPTETFPRIAQVWSGISGHEISALDVPLMLAGLKAVRAQVTPDYSDNSDDIEGFLAIFRELVGDDMIHARLVSEYIEKKFGNG